MTLIRNWVCSPASTEESDKLAATEAFPRAARNAGTVSSQQATNSKPKASVLPILDGNFITVTAIAVEGVEHDGGVLVLE